MAEGFGVFFKYLQKNILINLYKYQKVSFKEIFDVVNKHIKVLIDCYSSIEYRNEGDLETAVNFVEEIEKSKNDCSAEIIWFYENLLKIKSTNDVIEAMENEYNTNFDKGTFSRAITVKPSDFEETIYQELAKLLNIEY